MLDKFRSMIINLSLIVVVLGLGAYLLIRMHGGEGLFGDKEGTLQKVDFSVLAHTPGKNGYLLCDPDNCPEAIADDMAAEFTVTSQVLRRLLVDYTDSMPTIRNHDMDIINNQFAFVERMPGDKFPSVVTVRLYDDELGKSRMTIYSYSPMDDKNSDDHKARVERWVRSLSSTN